MSDPIQIAAQLNWHHRLFSWQLKVSEDIRNILAPNLGHGYSVVGRYFDHYHRSHFSSPSLNLLTTRSRFIGGGSLSTRWLGRRQVLENELHTYHFEIPMSTSNSQNIIINVSLPLAAAACSFNVLLGHSMHMNDCIKICVVFVRADATLK